MTFLAMFGFLLSILSALVLAVLNHKSHTRELQLLERLRQSPLYQELYMDMRALNHYDIDQVRIECSGVTIISVCPAHTILDFKFKQNGNSLRNDTFTRLFAELIARDFPVFAQSQAYKVQRYKVYRVNDRVDTAYAFVMRRGYKDFLLAERSPAQLRIY
ncbi:MAG: hypothetical protein GX171_05740 [Clostridiales bacterium]|nr:hypothetical protein [Clostridiales bacterium]